MESWSDVSTGDIVARATSPGNPAYDSFVA